MVRTQTSIRFDEQGYRTHVAEDTLKVMIPKLFGQAKVALEDLAG